MTTEYKPITLLEVQEETDRLVRTLVSHRDLEIARRIIRFNGWGDPGEEGLRIAFEAGMCSGPVVSVLRLVARLLQRLALTEAAEAERARMAAGLTEMAAWCREQSDNVAAQNDADCLFEAAAAIARGTVATP